MGDDFIFFFYNQRETFDEIYWMSEFMYKKMLITARLIEVPECISSNILYDFLVFFSFLPDHCSQQYKIELKVNITFLFIEDVLIILWISNLTSASFSFI